MKTRYRYSTPFTRIPRFVSRPSTAFAGMMWAPRQVVVRIRRRNAVEVRPADRDKHRRIGQLGEYCRKLCDDILEEFPVQKSFFE